MKLSYQEMAAVTFGAVRTWVDEGGFHASKCTEKQVEAWRAIEPILGERAEATTGIRLDFHTDAKALRFRFSRGNKVEVYIDGLFRQLFRMQQYREREETAEISLTDPLGAPLQDARVTLSFPSHDDPGVLESLELVEGTYCTPHSHDCKLLFIGDSITQGWQSHHDPASYAWRVTRHFNADSVICGVGGGIFHGSVFDRIDFDPDVVFVAFGTNDFGHYKTLGELRAAVKDFLSQVAAEYAGKKLFYISPVWRAAQEKPMGSFAACRAAEIEVATACGFTHIDGLKLVPPGEEYFTDGLHPEDNGFSFYAENLLIALRPYLK